MRGTRAILAAAAACTAALFAPALARATVTSSVVGSALSVTSDASDNIVIGCPGFMVEVNGADPDTGPAFCSGIGSIDVTGGPGPNLIELATPSGFSALTSSTVHGGDGNDTIYGAEIGTQVLDGETGGDVVVVNLGYSSPVVQASDSGADPSIDVLAVHGSGGSDSIVVGNASVNDGFTGISYSGLEALAVFAMGGNDTVDASSATAPPNPLQLDGGDGDDVLSGAPSSPTYLAGGSGSDTLSGGNVADTLVVVGDNGPIASHDTLGDLGGNNSLVFGDANAPATTGVTVDLALSAAQAIDPAGDTVALNGVHLSQVDGTPFADHLTGSGVGTTIDGRAGDDELRPLGGDSASGGLGADTLIATTGSVTLEGGPDSDHFRVDLGSIGTVNATDLGPSLPDTDFLDVYGTAAAESFGLSSGSIHEGAQTVTYAFLEHVGVHGAGGNDAFDVSGSDLAGATLDGENGADAYTVHWGAIAGAVGLADTGAFGSDILTVDCSPGTVTSTATQVLNGSQVVDYSGMESGPNSCSGGGGISQDVTPPQVTALTISPSTVDVTAGSVTVSVDATITDNLSGVDDCNTYCNSVYFQSPSGQFDYGTLHHVSGNSFHADVVVPAASESGTWEVTVNAVDNAHNFAWLGAAQLAAAGLPSTITVISVPDTQAPEVTSLSFTPTTSDTTAGDAVVTIDATITDNASGVDDCSNYCQSLNLRSPSGQWAWTVLHHVSGDQFQGTITLPHYSEAGSWTAAMSLADNAHNSRYVTDGALAAAGLPSTYAVTDSNPDLTAPTVTGLTLSPDSVDVTGAPGTITVTATITDNLAGVDDCTRQCVSVSARSPFANQYVSTVLYHTSGNQYEGQMTVPRYAEAGLWSLGLYLPDLAGNGAFKDSTALEAAGLPSTIGVSKQLIGTVPPGGSATTDVEANGPTPTHPVETTLTTPVGGAVVLTETFNTMPTPGGYSILGQQIDITASPGTPADPLVLTFDFDASIIPPGTPLSSMTIFRNGVAVPDCTGPAGQAVPDPCVQSRTLLPGGDVRIVVNTSHASHWNFGFALNSAPLCTALSASPKTLWPANHKLAPISLAGATDPDGDSLSYLVTGVTQDEAIDGLGDGDASPDAVLTAAGKLLLRAERSGKGDGRVYRIAVEVSDGHGGTCTGTATVSVPKAQNGTAAKDSGGSFDSLG